MQTTEGWRRGGGGGGGGGREVGYSTKFYIGRFPEGLSNKNPLNAWKMVSSAEILHSFNF